MSTKKHYPLAIVEVLILQRFPYGQDSTFFYFALGKLLDVQIGDVVKVPWRSSEKIAVVVQTKRTSIESEPKTSWSANINSFVKNQSYFFARLPDKPINLKPISAILEKEYFSPNLLSRLRTASREYFVSWNHFAKSVAEISSGKIRPNVPSKNSHLKLLGQWIKTYPNTTADCSIQHLESSAISFSGKNIPFIFASYEQESCLQEMLKKTIQEGKQVLVLVPEKTHLITIASKYSNMSNSFGISSPILMGKFLPQAFFRYAWKLTRTDNPYIFVGTRSSIFAPYANLGLIIIEDGHDSSHKQWDLSPLYDLRNLIGFLYPEVLKIYLSDTPRLQDFYNSPYYLAEKNRGFAITKLDPNNLEKQKMKTASDFQNQKSPHTFSRFVKYGKSKSEVILINMTVERVISSEASPVSNYLKKNLISELKKGKSALLIANHGGIANLIMCQDCGYVFKCPKCGKALSQGSQSQDCRFCGFHEQNNERCPRCSGIKLILKNLGIDKVKEQILEIKKKVDFNLFIPPDPGAKYADILQFSKKILAEKEKPNIILGYSGIIPIGRALKNKIGLAAVLSFDEILFYPDFRSEERAAARFYNLLSFAPKIYIQTNDPMQPYLQKIIQNPYSLLFQDWIRERRNYNYPPFTELFRIDIPNTKFIAASKVADKIVDELQKERSVIEALAIPINRLTKKNKYGATVIAKFNSKTDSSHIINNLFKKFGNLRIDPDPEEF